MAFPTASQLASVRRRENTPLAYGLLYVPVVLAWLFATDPLLSFGLAWAGSWWILWISMSGWVRPLPSDRKLENQLFRPLFLSQLMFFGLFCFGSIFYVWDLATVDSLGRRVEEIQRTAAAQRYYLLGHAAFVHGILALMDYKRSGEWDVQTRMSRSTLFLIAAGAAFGLAFLFEALPGMGQFAGKLQYLTVAGIILGTAYALRDGSSTVAFIGLAAYGYLFFTVLLSGWKSQVIIVVGLLLLALYPRYRKTTIVGGMVAAIFFVTLLPAYTNVFRQLNWERGVEAELAAQVAAERVISGEVNTEKESWAFLRGRLSTTGLFTDYIQSTPSRNPYYGFSTVKQALYAIIPRVLWPSKPNTEEVVMQRVYENTNIRPGSSVSAKPLIVTDGYLAGGIVGVFFGCFILGCLASIASKYAERWFGGYEIGGQLVYTGLFARVLFVASFEFLLNALFWSFILMVVLGYGLQALGIIRWAGNMNRHVQAGPEFTVHD